MKWDFTMTQHIFLTGKKTHWKIYIDPKDIR